MSTGGGTSAGNSRLNALRLRISNWCNPERPSGRMSSFRLSEPMDEIILPILEIRNPMDLSILPNLDRFWQHKHASQVHFRIKCDQHRMPAGLWVAQPRPPASATAATGAATQFVIQTATTECSRSHSHSSSSWRLFLSRFPGALAAPAGRFRPGPATFGCTVPGCL